MTVRHYELSRSQGLFSAVSIIAASSLLTALALRILAYVDVWQWWVPFALAGGIAAADFASGLVHWAADTWGRDDMPIIGHRLLVPFRVHHLNPDDFLRRRFIDTNGDVAFVAVPALSGLLNLPLNEGWSAAAVVFGFGFCGIGMLTNQIHQWAHMPSPPALVRLLQDCRLLLGRQDHAAHHARPYDVHYCITTGWWNHPLESIDFFRRLEALVRRTTGARPREDDRRYEARYGV
jgi:ubiquitin-conjugating enzyme E2 variant